MDRVTVISNRLNSFGRIIENIADDFEHLPGIDARERIGRKDRGLISGQVDSPIGWYAEKFPVIIRCVTQNRALIVICRAWNKDG